MFVPANGIQQDDGVLGGETAFELVDHRAQRAHLAGHGDLVLLVAEVVALRLQVLVRVGDVGHQRVVRFVAVHRHHARRWCLIVNEHT